jgi:hypothetical protein
MPLLAQPDPALEQRLASLVLDVLIRAGLILAMALLCYQVLSPFLTLMVWALILAVTLYPLHQALASKIGGKQGLAATLLVVVGIVLIVVPTAMLLSSLSHARGEAPWVSGGNDCEDTRPECSSAALPLPSWWARCCLPSPSRRRAHESGCWMHCSRQRAPCA